MNGRSWAGKIENFIDLNIEREADVVAHQLKAGIRPQMMHVASGAGVEIIDAQDIVAAFQQPIAKVRSNKSSSAGNEDTTFYQHGQASGTRKSRVETSFLSFVRLVPRFIMAGCHALTPAGDGAVVSREQPSPGACWVGAGAQPIGLLQPWRQESVAHENPVRRAGQGPGQNPAQLWPSRNSKRWLL